MGGRPARRDGARRAHGTRNARVRTSRTAGGQHGIKQNPTVSEGINMYQLVDVTTIETGEAVEIWDQICDAIERYRRIFLFLDFDGTLSEIVEMPSAAKIDCDALAAL